MSDLGPVEMLVVGFPDAEFHGDIVPELRRLIDNGTISVLDLLFVAKEADGSVEGFEVSDLPEGVRIQYEGLSVDGTDLLSEEDVADLGDVIDPGSAIAAIVIEHRWAADLAGAMRANRGELLSSMRIPAEAVQQAQSLSASAS